MRLNYLYLLTVADVRGTNPRLWNSWKGTLFRDLYNFTARALRNGLENPVERAELIRDKQDTARSLLVEKGIDAADVDALWSLMTEDYFLRYRGSEIAWHTEVLIGADLDGKPGLLDVRRQPHGDGIEALLYTPRRKRTFAQATSRLAELGMTIADARIVPLQNGFSLDTFVFLELDPRNEIDDSRLARVRRSLAEVLTTADERAKPVTRPASRQVRMFPTEVSVQFDEDVAKRRTILEIVAGDRPGLLSTIGQVFIECHIDIDTAKVVTIGERAEDVFYIVDENGKPLTREACDALRTQLIERLKPDS